MDGGADDGGFMNTSILPAAPLLPPPSPPPPQPPPPPFLPPRPPHFFRFHCHCNQHHYHRLYHHYHISLATPCHSTPIHAHSNANYGIPCLIYAINPLAQSRSRRIFVAHMHHESSMNRRRFSIMAYQSPTLPTS